MVPNGTAAEASSSSTGDALSIVDKASSGVRTSTEMRSSARTSSRSRGGLSPASSTKALFTAGPHFPTHNSPTARPTWSPAVPGEALLKHLDDLLPGQERVRSGPSGDERVVDDHRGRLAEVAVVAAIRAGGVAQDVLQRVRRRT